MRTNPEARHILTITLNPALDISTSTTKVMSDHKVRCGTSRLDPGGGGVNVSRVIRRLGGRTLAIYTVGGPIGDAYRRLVESERVPGLVVPIRGDTRQSFTVDDTSADTQYRFVLEGPELDESEWDACLDYAAQTVTDGGYIVASGSLPPGVPDDFYARVIRLAHDSGARCVVDATGVALTEALHEGAFLVAPSRRELAEHLGRPLDSEASEADAASALIAAGSAEYVALKLGERGAILASREGILRLPAPHVQVIGTVGTGDSFLAALVLRMAQGRTPEDAFCAAVAAGAAAMTSATELCHRSDVERLEQDLVAATHA